MSVKRFDRGELAKPTKTTEGWLVVEGKIARTGVLVYRKADGSEFREFRPDTEVFNRDSLASFSLRPVTVEHPDEWLNPGNVHRFSVGTVGENVRADGEYVTTRMLITSDAGIKALETGEKRELSCGYTCDLEPTAGEWRGQRYDAVQRNIRGNHVAITGKGRSGPDVAVRMDADDAVEVEQPTGSLQAPTHREDSPMASMKVRVGGVDYEASEQLAQAVAKQVQDSTETLKAALVESEKARGELAKLQARADGLAEELKKAEAARRDAEDPKKLREQIKARVELETTAKDMLGSSEKLDTLTDMEIKTAVVKKAFPERKLDGKSAEYIQAAFDLAVEKLDAEEDVATDKLAQARKALHEEGEEHEDGADPADDEAAYQRMLKANRNAWKKPLASSLARGE